MIWLANIILDHKGGQLDKVFTYLVMFMLLVPVTTTLSAFYVSSAYGDTAQVALNSDWAMTIA